MNNQFDESSLNEQAINDVETAKLALRWALDKIRALQEDTMRSKQSLQDKSTQVSFLENQLKNKNSEIDRILRSHEEEMKSKQDSLEYQFKAKLERLTEREKELEDKISKQEELLKQKETRLMDDYQKKADELRSRWANVEAELWQLRQEQMLKQQEFEKIYAGRLEDERKRSAKEVEDARAALEKTYSVRIEELQKREAAIGDELKKQEAVLKWAKDSFQQDMAQYEKNLKHREIEVDKKLLEKNQEIDDQKVKISLLEKQLTDLPEAVRKRDEDLERYKKAMESLEGVIRSLEDEKRNLQKDTEQKLLRLGEALEVEKGRYRDMEAEIPKRLKIAVEHERTRFLDKVNEVENSYKEDLRKKQEEIEYLERNLKTFEETMNGMRAERDSSAQRIEHLQTQYSMKVEEAAFREKQLQSEYDVRLKVEMEKQMRSVREELETSRRIYEDNLRLKIEEIAHLRRELENMANERIVFESQSGELRRAMSALKEKADKEVMELRTQLKATYEKQSADDLAAAERRFELESRKIADSFESRRREVDSALLKKDEELQRAKADLVRLEEEKREAILEERQRTKAEVLAQSSANADTIKIYEDKIVQLNKMLDSVKIEREEVILLERERLERLYTEKERDFDDLIARKDQEITRLREEAMAFSSEVKNAKVEAEKERELQNARIQALNDRLIEKESEFQKKVEEVAGREGQRMLDAVAKKNQELEALRLAKDTQEDAYRRSLEDFRHKLGEAVSRLETLKKMADERQLKVEALEMALAQSKKYSEEENAALSARLAAKEKDYRDMRAYYDNLKNVSEERIKEAQREVSECMAKFKGSQEQRAATDKTIENQKKELEYWKAEAAKKDDEMNGFKSAFEKNLEMERKDARAAHERFLAEFAVREKAINREVMALKDAMNAKDVAIDQLKAQAAELERSAERQRESSKQQAEALAAKEARYELRIKALEEENQELKEISRQYEQSKKLVEQLKEKIKSWKNQ